MASHARLVAALLLAIPAAAQGTMPRPGIWRAELSSPGGPLPFGLDLQQAGGRWQAFLINGEERIRLRPPRVFPARKRMEIDFAPYDSHLEADWDQLGLTMHGTWIKRGGQAEQRMRFVARLGERRRFEKLGGIEAGKPLATRYRVRFAKDEHDAVGIFREAEDGNVTGTFLTAVGDYRYLVGNRDGRNLRLSTFDGAHAFLFRARIEEDGSLKGDFWHAQKWHETFVARPDPKAELPDPWGLGEAAPQKLSSLRFPDLNGKQRSLEDADFTGTARLIVVFGSWCPNCRDATKYLNELQQRYGKRGLKILGLAFERSGDQGVDTQQLKRYVEMQGIRYPVLLAGLADKAKASAALPLLDRVRAYPTIIFLDRNNGLHGVYTGFAGPATGSVHTRLKEQFEKRIEKLLAGGRAP